MPFKEQTMSEQRLNMVKEIISGAQSLSSICRKYSISRPTAYLWVKRYKNGYSMEAFSRAPKSRPSQTNIESERVILEERNEHPDWGARKLKAHIERETGVCFPAASTIHAILQRNNQITAEATQAATPYKRFVRERPNDMWQCDFKGNFGLKLGGRCYPLVVMDDHSRFKLSFRAFPGERLELVKAEFILLFRENGLPYSLLSDNGNPWGSSTLGYTLFEIFLMNLDVLPIHSRPFHPQTQGKVERLNRTIESGVIKRFGPFDDLSSAQICFDAFRNEYNNIRPHESLKYFVPSDVYRKSERLMPETIKSWEYSSDYMVYRVSGGRLTYKGIRIYISEGFDKEYVGIKQSDNIDIIEIHYRNFLIAEYHLLNKCFVTKRIKRVNISKR